MEADPRLLKRISELATEIGAIEARSAMLPKLRDLLDRLLREGGLDDHGVSTDQLSLPPTSKINPSVQEAAVAVARLEEATGRWITKENVADFLGIPPQAAGVRLSRAKQHGLIVRKGRGLFAAAKEKVA